MQPLLRKADRSLDLLQKMYKENLNKKSWNQELAA
jgi:hypothetical protein